MDCEQDGEGEADEGGGVPWQECMPGKRRPAARVIAEPACGAEQHSCDKQRDSGFVRHRAALLH